MKSLGIIEFVSVCALLLSFSLGRAAGDDTLSSSGPKLTSTLVAWMSSQSEVIIEEMEAISKQNGESNQFSVVNYLRFLNLFDSLQVIASKQIDELKWVRKKIAVFNRHRVYEDALKLVTDYLRSLDAQLTKIELNEPKSRQIAVGKEWVVLYESILYIATHAPKKSGLRELATSYLTSSPSGTTDKVRSTRYRLKTNNFSRK